MGQIVSWVGLVLHRAEIRSDMKRVFNSANRKRERAAAVSESHAHRWETVEHAAEHHRTDRQRCLGRHANQPRQPIVRHALLTEHIPWMNKNRRVKLFCRTPDRLKGRIVQIYSIDSAGKRACINMGADLRAA